MPVPLSRNAFTRLSAIVILLLWTNVTVAQTVWLPLFPHGTQQFTKAAGSDHTLPQNQDLLTPNVILTRGSAGGLINLAAETTFNALTSPQGTEWATSLNNPDEDITVRNWESLSFTNWLDAYGGGSMISQMGAVVHLVSDNIYLYLDFGRWDEGDGGGYSYVRSSSTYSFEWTGDYNDNGRVDAADYVVWRKWIDSYLPQLGCCGDGNADGIINSDDYGIWRARFGNVVSAAAFAAAVPEPSTLLLALMGPGLLILRRTVRVTRHYQVNVAIAQWLPAVWQRTGPTLLIQDSSFARIIKTSSMKSRLKWTTRHSSSGSLSGCGRVRGCSPKRSSTTASRAQSIAVEPKCRSRRICARSCRTSSACSSHFIQRVVMGLGQPENFD